MAQNAANKHTTPSVFEKISQFLPIVGTLKTYRRDMLSGDVLAGLIVAIMLIPQGMAYALLAGLPPQVGLYASILPLILYGMLGTSRHLAVGPVAIVSLLTASSIGLLAAEGTPQYMQFAILFIIRFLKPIPFYPRTTEG